MTPAQLTRLASLSDGDGGVLGNVVVTATIDAVSGALGEVTGVREKLLGAIRDEHVPRLSAFVVSKRQDLLAEPGMAVHKDGTASPRLLGCADFGELIDALAGLRHRRPGVAPVDFHHLLQGTYRAAEFTGRQWLFERIEAAFRERDRGFIVVAAAPGFGKTAFALELIERWRETGIGDVALAAWHVLRKTEATWWPAVQMVEQLEWRLRDRLGCPLGEGAERLTEKNAAQALKQALNEAAAQAAKAGQRLLLVVDGLDEAFGANAPAGAEQAWLLREIFPGPQALPKGVFVLFTSRPGGHLAGWLTDEAVLVDVDRDEAAQQANEADLGSYLEARLAAVADREALDDGKRTRTQVLVRRMTEACEGAFFVAEWFARKAEKEPERFEGWLSGEVLPRGIDGTLREDWRHKLGSLRQDSARRLFPVLAAAIAIWHEAGTKVSGQIIEDLFESAAESKPQLGIGPISAKRIDREDVEACLGKLHDWFDAGAEDNPPSYTFRHSRIPELILDKSGTMREVLVDERTQREVHRLLGWTSSQWKELHGDSLRAALANAPWHFAQAGLLGSALKADPIEGGAMRLLAHWHEPQPYLAAVYTELDNAVAVLSRNYAAAIQLAAEREQPSHAISQSKEPDPLTDPLLHLRDVWRVLSEYGELLREKKCCPLAPTLYNHLAAAWDPDSQAHQDLVQAAESYKGTWLQRMNPEPPDRRLIAVLRGHTRPVTCLALSPDGTRLASGSEDDTVRLWDAYTGVPLGEPLSGHRNTVKCLAWSPDGSRLASGSVDETVRIWETQSGTALCEGLAGHTGSVTCIAWSPDNTRLASGSRDGTVRLWDAQARAPFGDPLGGHLGRVDCLVWSPDGAWLASASDGEPVVRIWNAHVAAAGHEPLTGHTGHVCCLAWSPDGSRLASGSWDHTVRLWDPRSNAPLREPLTGHTSSVTCLAWSHDGTTLASGSNDRTVRLWDGHTGAPLGSPLTGHTDWINCLAWSSDSALLATGSDDDTVRIWDVRTGAALGKPLFGHSTDVESVVWSPDGARLASRAEKDSNVRLWGAIQETAASDPPHGEFQQVQVAALSPDGKRMASGSEDGSVRLWDSRTCGPVAEPLTGHSSPITCLSWSPDSTHLASGALDRTVRLWDASTGAQAGGPLIANFPWIKRLAWSPDGTRLAEVGPYRTLRLWDVRTAKVLSGRMIGCTAEDIRCLVWSPDSTCLATGSKDGTVDLWDGRTGMPAGATLMGHTDSVSCLAWAPDGARLASGSYDRTIRFWDARIRTPLGDPLSGHTDWVNCLAWSPDGATLAAGLDDGALYLWETRFGKDSATTLPGHRGPIANLAWLPQEARFLVSVSSEGELRLWDALEVTCIACAMSNGAASELRTSGDDCLVAGQKAGIFSASQYRLREVLRDS